MEFFDSHAHYDDNKFNEDREKVINSLKEAGVTRCVNIGCDILTSMQSIDLSNKYDFIYATVGIHPSDIEKNAINIGKQVSKIKDLAQQNKKVVAIGEIGLDYYWHNDNKDLQREAFIKQIELANELDLPIVIHTRDAIDDTIDIIKNKVKINNSGVLHCCPFNRELVKHGLEAGLYIAFGGTCTFKNSKNADEIINMVPMDRILIETDSPYLSPEPFRGKRNDSKNLKYVVRKLANARGTTEEVIAKITYDNAMKMFKLDKIKKNIGKL